MNNEHWLQKAAREASLRLAGATYSDISGDTQADYILAGGKDADDSGLPVSATVMK